MLRLLRESKGANRQELSDSTIVTKDLGSKSTEGQRQRVHQIQRVQHKTISEEQKSNVNHCAAGNNKNI